MSSKSRKISRAYWFTFKDSIYWSSERNWLCRFFHQKIQGCDQGFFMTMIGWKIWILGDFYETFGIVRGWQHLPKDWGTFKSLPALVYKMRFKTPLSLTLRTTFVQAGKNQESGWFFWNFSYRSSQILSKGRAKFIFVVDFVSKVWILRWESVLRPIIAHAFTKFAKIRIEDNFRQTFWLPRTSVKDVGEEAIEIAPSRSGVFYGNWPRDKYGDSSDHLDGTCAIVMPICR